ncbi:MAG TPA: hypothetical protein VM841_04390 [Actinomycetota bacterium]|nr:hypothetical protein [Actinomycetota bacterium]
MSGVQGLDSGGIPRWITGLVFAAIVAALAVVVPAQVRAAHTPSPSNLCVCFRMSPTAPKLTWSDTAGSATIQGYILQRSRTADFTSAVIEIRIARNTFDFIDETIEFNTRFYYRVASYLGSDRSGWSNVVSATNGNGTYPTKPATPSDLTLSNEGGGLRVSWSNPATNETGVWVQRSSDNGATWEYRASLAMNSTSYHDNDVPAGAPMYRVATFNSAGASYSYSVQYVNQNAPGVPTVGPIAPSIPAMSIPGFPSVGIPSVGFPTVPGFSVPPGLIPSNPTAIASPWLNMLPSNPTAIASPWLNLIPSNPTAIASPWLNMIPSNPATLVPTVRDPLTYRVWIGLRFGSPQNQPVGVWILPATCFGFGCPPPSMQPPSNCIGFRGALELCYLADATLN